MEIEYDGYFSEEYNIFNIWQAHIQKLLDTDKTYKIIKFTSDNSGIDKALYQKLTDDLMRFILITLYFEIPHHSYAYVKNNKTNLNIKELRSTVTVFETYIKYMNSYFTKYRSLLVSRELLKNKGKNSLDIFEEFTQASANVLNYLKKEPYVPDFLYYSREGFEYRPDENYLLKRGLNSKSGMRNLVIRYIYLCLQVCFRNGLTKASLNKAAYKISNYILNVKDFYLDLTQDVFDKTVNYIDIENPAQCYAHTFHTVNGFFEFLHRSRLITIHEGVGHYSGDQEIIPHIMKWKAGNCSYILCKEFTEQQIKNSRKLKRKK